MKCLNYIALFPLTIIILLSVNKETQVKQDNQSNSKLITSKVTKKLDEISLLSPQDLSFLRILHNFLNTKDEFQETENMHICTDNNSNSCENSYLWRYHINKKLTLQKRGNLFSVIAIKNNSYLQDICFKILNKASSLRPDISCSKYLNPLLFEVFLFKLS